MKKDFKITVLTPVYNVEQYLDEAIRCVLDQTIGFGDNIQLILVNDGSPDKSGDICRKYADKYPDNIVYIEKENGGVSSARNAGLEYVSGKYIVFLDGDDYWDNDAFEKIYDFFEAHPGEFDVCTCRMLFAGDYEGREHPQEYKFAGGDRVVDLTEEPDIICTAIGNSAVRADAVGDIRFSQQLTIGEDGEFVSTIVLRTLRAGVLASANFHYRRMLGGSSGSAVSTGRKSWYLDVPREFYLGLFRKSMDIRGEVCPYIQNIVLYNIRWRKYDPVMMSVLSDDEKQQHTELMREVLSRIDDKVIRKAKGINQYKKLYLYELKYGYDLPANAKLKDGKLVHNKVRIFNYQAASVIRISVFEFSGDTLRIEGETRLSAAGTDYTLYVKDDKGSTYEAVMADYEKWDIRGFTGEYTVRGESFRVDVPVRSGMNLTLAVSTRSTEIELKPAFEKYMGINGTMASEYHYRDGYIVTYYDGVIGVVRDGLKNRLVADNAYKKGLKTLSAEDPAAASETDELHRHEMSIHKKMTASKTRDKVVFFTSRADDALGDNMRLVYDALDLPKEYMARREIYQDPELIEKAAELAGSAKVIVTDDYVFLCGNYRLRPDQHLVQLWHATGAFKQFGKDSGTMYPGRDRLYHRDYDLVTVSSESIRQTYADCFQIPVDRVKATGVARTDLLFDSAYREAAAERVYERHPELKGREIILYAPTFRDMPGTKRTVFTPDLDFRQLSAVLREDQTIVLCPHPAVTMPVLHEKYSNITEIRDVSTADMMFVSEMLITDYSSVMFEYALLGKPMAFYCYDYDTYERDFYLDMETDIPGPLLRTQEELTAYILGEHAGYDEEQHRKFTEKYLSACDGHSTERIVSEIKSLFAVTH